MKYLKKYLVIGMTIVMTNLMTNVNTMASDQTIANNKVVEDSCGTQEIQSYEQLIRVLEEKGHFVEAKQENRRTWPVEQTPNTQDMAETTDVAAKGEYSSTNVQVEGVDEADKVKLDGRYIYTCIKDSVAIVDTKDKMTQVASIKCCLGEWASYTIDKIFLEGEYLTVLLTGREQQKESEYYWNRGKSFVGVQIYNISDKKNFKLERSLKVEGQLEDMRMLDKKLYLVTNREVGYYVKGQDISESILPKYMDSVSDNEMKQLSAKGIRYFNWSNCCNYTTITTFDINNKMPAKYSILLSDSDEMYMNKEAMYFTEASYGNWYYDGGTRDDQTYIIKYAINKEEISYSSCTRVKGLLLNQFSMDEYKGYFRIATHTNEQDDNNVYILDKQLKVVGKLEGLAKGENIYSVRFDGDRGYVVTFEQIDPLFVLDLSDARLPKVLGKLKIPGFSQYLHPIGDDLVVGIGRATAENIRRDEEGNEVVTSIRATGIKLSLFNVKNPKEPKEINHIIIGDDYAYSTALQDHTAVMVDKKRQLLAIPVYLRFDGLKKITDTVSAESFIGAYVFGIENGKLVGKAKLGQVDRTTGKYQVNGRYYGSEDGRVCYIDNKMYYIYGDQINAYDLESFNRLQVIGLH